MPSIMLEAMILVPLGSSRHSLSCPDLHCGTTPFSQDPLPIPSGVRFKGELAVLGTTVMEYPLRLFPATILGITS